MKDNRKDALALAAHGWRLVPLHSPNGDVCDCGRTTCRKPEPGETTSMAKHPRITDWVNNASADTQQIEEWWTMWPQANIGIATGRKSGVVVVDVDPRNNGVESLMVLAAEHGLLPAGPQVATGGGGWHYYFKAPDAPVTNNHPWEGIDIQADGQQAVAPPSVHYTGVSYEWTENGPELELPGLPLWMLEEITKRPQRRQERLGGGELIPAGKRSAFLISRAGTVRRSGASEHQIFAFLTAVNEETCNPPLDIAEVAAIAASAAKYEPEEGVIISGTAPAARKGAVYSPTPFTARELQGMTLPEIKWAVPGLLPEGLALLAGRPKLGKSWMSFNIGIAVAEGAIALGDLPVDDGDVLILALEDTNRRLQARMRMMLGDTVIWPERLSMETKWPRQNEGGLEAIDAWLGGHPAARLVVIDTLARFKAPPAPGQKRGDVYAEDYAVIETLQDLAGRHGVSIVLITHYNKSFHEDWINAVTSSSGTTGAADTILGLERPRGSVGQKEAVLHITGRDVEEQDYAVAFDGQTGHWTITGAVEDMKVSKETAELIAVMMKIGHAVMPDEVAAAMAVTRATAYKRLYRASMNGYILSHGNKLYSLLNSDYEPQTGPNDDGIGIAVRPVRPTQNSDNSDNSDRKDSADNSDSDRTNSFNFVPVRGQPAGVGVRVPTAIHSTKSDSSVLSDPVRPVRLGGDLPVVPCPTCGQVVWTLRVGNRWLCEVCAPAVTSVRQEVGQ